MYSTMLAPPGSLALTHCEEFSLENVISSYIYHHIYILSPYISSYIYMTCFTYCITDKQIMKVLGLKKSTVLTSKFTI